MWVSFRTWNGTNYLSVDPKGERWPDVPGQPVAHKVNATATTVGDSEVFERIDLTNGMVAFRTVDGGYLTAWRGGGAELVSYAIRLGAWEQFMPTDRGNSKVDFVAGGGTSWSAVDAGGGKVVVARPQRASRWDGGGPGAWETFLQQPAFPKALVHDDLVARQAVPVALSPPCASHDENLFPLLVDEGQGKLVVGGPQRVFVVDLGQSASVFFSLAPKSGRFSGAALSGGFLYVQDGPVIQTWSLKDRLLDPDGDPVGRCTAAFNLLTNAQESSARGLTASALVGVHDTALAANAGAAADAVFSAPVVRAWQADTMPDHSVFVLDSNGTLYALGSALESSTASAFDKPVGAPALAMLEDLHPEDPQLTTCRLFYASVQDANTTALVAVDADTLRSLWKWNRAGTPQPRLPLRARDGIVWGGGVLGWDLFGVQPGNSTATPVIDMPAPYGDPWRDAIVDTGSKLIVAVSGSLLQAKCYAPGVNQRDRAGSLAVRPGWVLALDGPTVPATTRLIMYVEQAAHDFANVVFRVSMANTVDPTFPERAPNFPPPPKTLAEGQLKPQGTGTIGALRAKPIITKDGIVYAVAGKPADQTAYLHSFSTAKFVPKVAALTGGELRRIQWLARGEIRVAVQAHYELDNRNDDPYSAYVIYESRTTPMMAVKQLPVSLVDPQSGEVLFTGTTDADGVVRLEVELLGRKAMLRLADCDLAQLQWSLMAADEVVFLNDLYNPHESKVENFYNTVSLGDQPAQDVVTFFLRVTLKGHGE